MTMDASAPTLRILPGQWRPQFPFEQVAWISSPWPPADYLWLDFPEAVFIDGTLTYLGHISEKFPSAYTDLPKVPWHALDDGIAFERLLPNGLHFAGQLTRASDHAVAMAFTFTNKGDTTLRNIALQTCAYVRPIRELADYTHENIFVHTADGWTKLNHALEHPREDGTVRLGWRDGPKAADWPLIVCLAAGGGRGAAMTWFDHTLSLIGNPDHPCFHADPFVNDLAPGESDSLRGVLLFFEGDLADLDYTRDVVPYA